MRLARADAAPITFKLHHAFSAVSSVHEKFLAPWARKVEADANGRIHIDIFPSMELGGAPAQLFDQARDGDADIVWTAPGLDARPFSQDRDVRIAVSAVAPRAGQFEGAAGFRRDLSERRIRRGSSAMLFMLGSRGHPRLSRRCARSRISRISSCMCRRGLPARRCGSWALIPCRCRARNCRRRLTERVIDGCVDPWHMVPPFRLNDLLKTHTEFSDLSLIEPDLCLGDEQAGLRTAAA